MRAPKTYNTDCNCQPYIANQYLIFIISLIAKLTIIPGDDACIMSGLNRATSEIIRGLSARERGTFWYQGQGKLQRVKNFENY